MLLPQMNDKFFVPRGNVLPATNVPQAFVNAPNAPSVSSPLDTLLMSGHYRLAAIAEKHIEALKAQRSSLIIAPTHGECRAIAGAVRKAMTEKGLLLESEHSVMRLQRLNLTDS